MPKFGQTSKIKCQYEIDSRSLSLCPDLAKHFLVVCFVPTIFYFYFLSTAQSSILSIVLDLNICFIFILSLSPSLFFFDWSHVTSLSLTYS